MKHTDEQRDAAIDALFELVDISDENLGAFREALKAWNAPTDAPAETEPARAAVTHKGNVYRADATPTRRSNKELAKALRGAANQDWPYVLEINVPKWVRMFFREAAQALEDMLDAAAQPASAVAERLSLDGPPRVGDLVLVNDDLIDDDESGDWRGIVIEAPDASKLLKVIPLPMRLNAGRPHWLRSYSPSQHERVRVIARAGYDVDAEIREQSK